MLEALEVRGRRIGARATDRIRRRLIEKAGERGGVAAEESDAGVALVGRGLRRRAFDDPRLRWIAGWLR